MESKKKDNTEAVAGHFCVEGVIEEVKPFGSGHINDTFAVASRKGGRTFRYVLQRINHLIFKDPFALMENVIRVTDHIRSRVSVQNPVAAGRQLIVIRADNGTGCFKDPQGNYWRMYNMIEDAITLDTMDSPPQAFEAARMFGWFQQTLADLPGSPLHETIPDFHHTPRRFRTFQQILEKDPCNRAVTVKPEIDFVLKNAWICDVLLGLVDKGQIPVRITHNDTKINNVMLDKDSGRGVCVIDLDTVMPGLSLYDFGDMVRTATSPADEDEKDISKVTMRMEFFEQLVRGFASETADLLTPVEKTHLAFSGMLITFEQLIRFLGDHIAGDVYYKIARPGHNLDRSRTQMMLVESIMAQEKQMNRFVEGVWKEIGA